jgi:hypothetical protein
MPPSRRSSHFCMTLVLFRPRRKRAIFRPQSRYNGARVGNPRRLARSFSARKRGDLHGLGMGFPAMRASPVKSRRGLLPEPQRGSSRETPDGTHAIRVCEAELCSAFARTREGLGTLSGYACNPRMRSRALLGVRQNAGGFGNPLRVRMQSAYAKPSFARRSPERGRVWEPSQGTHAIRVCEAELCSAFARTREGLGTLSGFPSRRPAAASELAAIS